MAQIEIMALWAGRASALVGSQEYVNMDGIEYDVVLNKLNATPSMTTDKVAEATSESAIYEKTRPVEKTSDWAYYHSLDFAQTTGWEEFEDLFAH